MSADEIGAGFCGKLPASADFVQRRLPLASVEAWHGWLGAALAASRAALGPLWLAAYLNGPIWRFAVPPGLAGPLALAGTLMPSVDRIGRYFPLSLVVPLASTAALAGFVRDGEPWFAAAEALSLAALEDGVDLDAFATSVAALPLPPPPAPVASDAGAAAIADPGIVLSLNEELPLAALAAAHLAGGNSLWLTLGSAEVSPVALFAAALPRPAAFAALLTGRWAEQGWRDDGSILAPGGGAARRAAASP